MRSYRRRHISHPLRATRNVKGSALFALMIAISSPCIIHAQTANADQMMQQIERLTNAMAKTQGEIEESQRELSEMREQLKALQAQMSANAYTPAPQPTSQASETAPDPVPKTMEAEIENLRERQDVEESQLATHEQAKVESESKYPVKITGLILFTSFVNTSAVDVPATPSVAVYGSGSTGATIRQTVLGFDAHGPHLFGAQSYANLRVDFDGNPQSGSSPSNYIGYYAGSSLLRLRTAHAGLHWEHTDAFFSLDKPLFSPDTPTSLTAVAQPALAWSGNLWSWNPQVGLTRTFDIGSSHAIQLQAALIDPGDAPVAPIVSSAITGATAPSTAQQSRWPGTEAHVSLIGSPLSENGNHVGVGGYFSPHLTSFGERFDAWAGTLDTHIQLPFHLEWISFAYRGAALGGLGGGAFKDYAYRVGSNPAYYYFRPLDDVGGWTQLKERLNKQVELNAAFGLDNVFSDQLRPFAVPNGTIYQNLARNRTYTGNLVYSPSAYLMFSLEYRHLASAPVVGPTMNSNIIGIGAGYKF
jgi:hypothetical protein